MNQPATYQETLVKRQSFGGLRWLNAIRRFARQQPVGAVSAAVLLLVTATAIAAPVLASHDPLAMNTSNLLRPPGESYVLGTDRFGRDVLSRIMYGGRISLYVGFLAVGFGTGLGAILGLVSGYVGGKTDLALQRVLDALMAFPMLVLALVIVSALGPALNNVVLAIGIVLVPRAARVVRSSVLAIRTMQYIEAARATGANDWRVMVVHVLPNCFAPWLVYATGALGQAIVTEATLSFLGLGTPPPIPSWGSMISGEARSLVTLAPWLPIFPGIALTAAAYSFNMFGDALRDVLDPRLRR